MTQEQIQKHNIMAEFVGYRKAGNGWLLDAKLTGTGLPWIVTNENDFCFHSNYNFLLLAWAKFRDFNIGWKEFAMGSKNSEELTRRKQIIGEHILHDGISKAFTALEEAIKWYNENKQ